jgi:hypothetical protein
MRTIKVTYEDGNTTTTQINGSEEEIRRYYVGKTFNLGQPHDPTQDRLVKAVSVEFLDRTPGDTMNRWLTDAWHTDMATMLQRQATYAGSLDSTRFYAFDGKAYSLRNGTVSDLGDWFEFQNQLRVLKITLTVHPEKA